MSKALYMILSLESKKRILKNRESYLKRLTESYKSERAMILTEIHDLKMLIKEDEQKDGEQE